jgi:hypothetical protein
MISTAKHINPSIKMLRSIIKDPSRFHQTKQLLLKLHELADDECFSMTCDHGEHMIMPTPQDATIAWNFWHITRIEDMVVSRLIYHREEVFEKWQEKLNVLYRDTGNAMTDEEIIDLSKQLNFDQLMEYRKAVNAQTKEMIQLLKYSDLFVKVKKEDIQMLLMTGSVSQHPDAIWLLDFWGKKDVSGLLLMPILRHPFVHLFDNLKLMEKIKKMPKHLIDIE